MSNQDQSQRFLFENSPVRGQLAGLNQAYREVLSKHNYPAPVAVLIGEFMAAAVLLSARLKLEGSIILQVTGNGQVRTLMAECNQLGQVRAIAQYNDDFSDSGAILGSGQLAITLDPDKGNRYQGIVSMEDSQSLSAVLQDYFRQSEQLPTLFWLEADGREAAAGMLLQKLPDDDHTGEDEDLWNRVSHLASTVKSEELLQLDNSTILRRLFHEEDVRLFEAQDISFHCGCSRERSEQALLHLGLDEARELIQELGIIETDCQFCHQRYAFNEDEIETIFRDQRKSLN